MTKRPAHRWFQALVVTGASITACGGQTDDSAGDAAADTPSTPDATPIDVAPADADAGGSIIITIDGRDPREDVRTDPRCCIITR
jgi:hypothetical protein